MKVTAWAVFGLLLVTALVAPVVADVLGAVPVRAGQPHVRSATHAIAPARPGRVPAPAARHPGYLVEARMGWAVS
jgi:hypothetical protein